MTTVAVLADPPVEGVVCRDLIESTPLHAADGVRLYEAMLTDICRAVEGSGAQLLLNYRPREHLDLPESVSPKTRLEGVVSEAVDAPEAVRYEVQVGSTFAARAGNTVTHLLEQEGEGSVHVLEPTVPLVSRQAIDSASMKLRRSSVVVSPASGGRVGYAGFAETIDFDGAYDAPAVESLVDSAIDAGVDADFLPGLQPVRTPADLATVVPEVRARERAGRIYPSATADAIERLGLGVAEDESVTVSRS
ncbi:hypothetical protein [Halapricum salinum]|uniref:DUF2064 domain-containing protein n=1 Tax=Halapricum salinum TaxID=1457250 RepID=A0A4D6HFE2_9EURY|nr:hypothetical protein [Halapricum salinum]QCC52739.1 hypothetical protein DV733_16520 [Halapricum salinum]